MPTLRSNEWNFAANAAARITEVLATPEYEQSPLGRAEPERGEARGRRRLDVVIFSRTNTERPLITAELKVPWDPLGRSPYNTKVVEDAHSKAANCGAEFFVTWNIRRAVVWRTDDPGVPLPERVVLDEELLTIPLASPNDLGRPAFQAAWRKAVDTLVAGLHRVVTGRTGHTYVPLDRQFIARLESLLDFPIYFTTQALIRFLFSFRTLPVVVVGAAQPAEVA